MKSITNTTTCALLALAWLAPCGVLRAEQAAEPMKTSANEQPARFNKATSLVGMEVRNQQGERLGKIKDVVFDLRSERVAYAVLGTGESAKKLLAVPLSAFAPSANGAQLVLRADKSKLDAAQGLEPGNWPAATSQIWGAQPSLANATPAAHVSLPRR